MTHVLSFSSSNESEPPTRSIDNDAPEPMRNQLIDHILNVASNTASLDHRHFYDIIEQSIGERPSGQPYGGIKYALSRDLGRADWPKVYDVITRLWPEFQREELHGDYREGINRILADNKVVWELDEH